MLLTGTSEIFVVQEGSAHTRTWNLKAALGPKPCKVKQQIDIRTFRQHVLAKRVPNNPLKKSNFLTKEKHVQPCPISSVTHAKINSDSLGKEVP